MSLINCESCNVIVGVEKQRPLGKNPPKEYCTNCFKKVVVKELP